MASNQELQEQLQAAQEQIRELQTAQQDNTQQQQQQRQPSEIARVSVKNVPFFKEQPDLYFLQIEAQFRNAKITVDQTKYDHVIAQFDPKYLSKISDFLRDPPATGKYDGLKTRILGEFTDSDQKKLRKLIEGIELGDDKPSQLLKKMKELAGNALADDAIKTLFVQRLPETVRGVISIAEGDSSVWAKQADKMMETAQVSHVSAISQKDPVMNEIAALRKEIENLKTSRGRDNERKPSNQRERSKSKPNNKITHQVCYYHFKFGDKARKCLDPCDHATKPDDTKSEN